MKIFLAIICIAGILTGTWLIGFAEGKKHVARKALAQIKDILSDNAILWLSGGTHLLRKGEKLRDYLITILDKN